MFWVQNRKREKSVKKLFLSTYVTDPYHTTYDLGEGESGGIVSAIGVVLYLQFLLVAEIQHSYWFSSCNGSVVY